MGLSFDGTDDDVSIGDVLDKDGTGAFSISCWMLLAGDLGGRSDVYVAKIDLAGDNSGYDFLHTGNGDATFEIDGGSGGTGGKIRVDATGVLSQDTWQHVVVTYDGSQAASGVTMYVDGSSVTTSTATDNFSGDATNTVNLQFGERANGTAGLSGDLAHVAIWNKELTAAEVAIIVDRRLYSDTELDGYWPLDEGEGTTVSDYKQTNDGTINGATWDATSEPPVTDTAGGGVI